MKIRLTLDLKRELLKFKDYIQLNETTEGLSAKLKERLKVRHEKEIQDDQEFILTTLALLLSPNFQKTIQEWRVNYKINVTEILNDYKGDLYLWLSEQKHDLPSSSYDKRICNLCLACNVHPKIYGEFVLEYLYVGFDIPVTSASLKSAKLFDLSLHQPLKDEFRYKTRVELDYGEERDDNYTDEPQKVSIQIFKDTSKTGLIKFIETNWLGIQKTQRCLQAYPHTKKFEFFKRDMQVYLLHLLGKKPSEIASNLAKENIPDKEGEEFKRLEKIYSLDEERIYKITEDFDARIASIICKKFSSN